MKCFVFDTETSISKGPHGPHAKDPSNDFYTAIWGNRPDSVQIEHAPEGFKRNLPAKAAEMLANCDIIIGHNLPFDLSYIYHCPIFVDRLRTGVKFWDTQVAEYCMSGQRHSFASLGELQYIYLGKKIKDDRISKLYKRGVGADVIMANAKRCPRLWRAYEAYSKADGVTTLQVFEKQYKKAKEMGMLKAIELEMQYMTCLVMVSNTGIHVDVDKCQRTLRNFKLQTVDLMQQATKIVEKYWVHEDLPPFNIQSNTHKSAMLFGGDVKVKVKRPNGFYKDGREKTKFFEELVQVKGFGLPTHLSTPSKNEGLFATGADIIEKIYKDPSISEEVKEYCRLQKEAANLGKMCSTYLEPFLNLSINGVLYPNYNNTMTITGRLSSSKPNLQNVPSKGGMLEHIQGQLVAPQGYKCVSIDFSQLEIYVQAYLTQDKALTNDLLSGIDFHVLRLSYAEDMPYNEVFKLCKIDKVPEWESKRSKAKTISYQKAYGASPKSLAKTTEIDEEIIKKIFEKEDINYPNVQIFNDWVLQDIKENAVVSTMRMLPKAKKTGGVNGKKWHAGCELLPIQQQDGSILYDKEELRHVGYYTAVTGRRYSFEEMCRLDRLGRMQKGYSSTQTKNYFIQGTAGVVMSAVSVGLMPFILERNNVQMVNQIHDSIWFYIKDDEDLPLTIQKIKDIMENVPKLFRECLDIEVPFKFKVDVEIGSTFANTEPYTGEIQWHTQNSQTAA